MCVCLYYNLCNTLTATLLLIKIDSDHFSRSLRFVITDQFSLFFQRMKTCLLQEGKSTSGSVLDR